MVAATYSKTTSFARHQYDTLHEQCFMYEFEPGPGPLGGTGYASWPGTRPGMISRHGGGFANPDHDIDADRFPDGSLTNAAALLDVFRNAGFAIFIAEYPLGHHTLSNDNECTSATGYPDNFIAGSTAVSYIRDHLFDRIRPDEIVERGNSAGAWISAMIAWSTDASGFLPVLPEFGGTLSQTPHRSSTRPNAVVLDGLPYNFAQMDPSRARNGSPAPLTVIVSSPFRFRPKITFTATLAGTIVAGDWIQRVGDPTKSGTVVSIAGSAPATVVMLVQQGLATDFTASDVMEKRGTPGSTLTFTATPTILDYMGWLEVPTDWKVGISPASLLENPTPDIIADLKTCPVYATFPGNASAWIDASDPVDAVVPGVHGADDAAFREPLKARLVALGITHKVIGSIPAASNTETDGQIIDVSFASPMVVTILAASQHRTGDVIDIDLVTGNVAANNTFRIVRLSSTTFSLFDPVTGAASIGSGPYGGGGRWVYNNPTGDYHLSGSQLGDDVLDWLNTEVGIVP